MSMFHEETYITGEDSVRIHVYFQKNVREVVDYPEGMRDDKKREEFRKMRIEQIKRQIIEEVRKEVKAFDITTANSAKAPTAQASTSSSKPSATST